MSSMALAYSTEHMEDDENEDLESLYDEEEDIDQQQHLLCLKDESQILEEAVGSVQEDLETKEGDQPLMILDKEFLETLCVKSSAESYMGEEDEMKKLQFILVDIQLKGVDKDHGTCIELFGRAADGASVYASIFGWYSYLYIQAPSGWIDTQANKDCLCLLLQNALGTMLEQAPEMQNIRRMFYQFPSPIIKLELVKGTNIMGFDASRQADLFLKIYVASPSLITAFRTLFETQKKSLCILPHGAPDFIEGSNHSIPTFNSNLDPILQFMVDKNLSGCQWCSLPFLQITTTSENISRCQYELNCHVDQLELLDSEIHSDLGPLRVFSFDLEAAGRKGVFPDPGIDPVIQISIHMETHGQETLKKIKPILLSFKECAPIEDATVLSFEKEESMLLAFRDILISFDPDILTGYNICNFDMEYLQKRAEALGIGNEFTAMTRIVVPSNKKVNKDTKQQGPAYMNVREVYFQSAQVGKRKSNKVSIRGRVVLDVYLWMLNNFRLEEYKLDSVCKLYLPGGMSKEDLHFTEITPKWQAGPNGRKELGVYCLKDAELPLALIQTLNVLFNAVERARVIGIPMEYVLNRGNLVRFTSQLMRESLAHGFLLPFVDAQSPLRQDTTKYKGATVMEVKGGIWENVAVLDFSSMYPSIIVAANLCYSTLYKQGPVEGPLLRYQTHTFVDENTRKGIIPLILERMLEERKKAKEAYEKETDPTKKIVLKARELSIKVMNNGVYGAMGCRNALIPGRQMAETTTGIGRKDIQKVKEIAESMFTTDNGYPSNALIVGGDTDSVFVKMPIQSGKDEKEAIQEAISLGHTLAVEVNRVMKSPKRIAFEKVFRYLLLMKKKRYAGIKYENLKDKPQIDIKGIECVRRDGCPLIRNSILSIAKLLATTADVEAAAQLVRDVVSKIMKDEIPVEEYAIQKVLRKNMQDCAQPMTYHELRDIRQKIESPYLDPDEGKSSTSTFMIPLTEAEIDEAIRRGIPLQWRLIRKLPHVLVAWKMRLKDPGNAPVLGERVKYVVTLNGSGIQISAKAESLDTVSKGGIAVDRHFYLNTLRKAVDGLFVPIIEQRQGNVKLETERMLWKDLLDGRLAQNPLHQAERLAKTPIAQAFQKMQSSTSTTSTIDEDVGCDESKKKKKAGVQCTKLTMNQAEHAQMKDHVLRKKTEERIKRNTSLENSPLKMAFAKQAAKSKEKAMEK